MLRRGTKLPSDLCAPVAHFPFRRGSFSMLPPYSCGTRCLRRSCWGPLCFRGAAWPLWALEAGRRGKASSSFPLEVSASALPRDVLLFQHERPRFFRLLGLFCAGQAVFWASLAHLAFRSLRAPKRTEDDGGGEGEGGPFSSEKWRFGFTASCLAAVGILPAAVATETSILSIS